MNIWHISDTHTRHELLVPPEDIDVAIFSGDCSNHRNPFQNENGVRSFLTWFDKLNIEHKIMIAGNHDTSIEMGLIDRYKIESLDIIYLHNESITIDGVKIWGSPYVPTFGDWAFMKPTDQLKSIWSIIPDDTDIIVTHGPPKGILDLADSKSGSPDNCGCEELLKRVEQVKPKAHLFGHIHNSRKGIKNQGKVIHQDIIYSNASCVTDGIYNDLTSNGNKITIK